MMRDTIDREDDLLAIEGWTAAGRQIRRKFPHHGNFAMFVILYGNVMRNKPIPEAADGEAGGGAGDGISFSPMNTPFEQLHAGHARRLRAQANSAVMAPLVVTTLAIAAPPTPAAAPELCVSSELQPLSSGRTSAGPSGRMRAEPAITVVHQNVSMIWRLTRRHATAWK